MEQSQRIQLHPHRRQRRTADDHLADAVDLRELLLQHGARRIVHLAARERARGQRQDQHRRVGRVHLAIGRLRQQVCRQVGLGGVDRRLHVARRTVDVAVEPELQRDPGLPDLALRGDLGDVGDLAQVPLERSRQAGRDHVRTGAGQLRLHADGGEVDLRQRRHRELGVAEHAGERDRDQQQSRRHRPGDERRRDVQVRVPPVIPPVIPPVQPPDPVGRLRCRGSPGGAAAARRRGRGRGRSPGW